MSTYVPTGQGRHDPGLEAYVPALHGSQNTFEGMLVVPGVHGLQYVWLVIIW
jgi:hypothetical protein